VCGEADVRTVFVGYLLVIVVGISYFVAVAAVHH
jgi:hypothetical protein